MARRAPRRSQFGGRVRLDRQGRARGGDGRFLSKRQLAAREAAFHREVKARETARTAREKAERAARTRKAAKALRGRELAKPQRRRPGGAAGPPAKRRPSRPQPRIPRGAPRGGQYLPQGYLGELRAERLRLLVSGQETAWVTVKVGPAEFRLRNNEESIRRWIAGAAIARAIQDGSRAAAGISIGDLSDLVIQMEADGYDALEGFDPGDAAVELSPG